MMSKSYQFFWNLAASEIHLFYILAFGLDSYLFSSSFLSHAFANNSNRMSFPSPICSPLGFFLQAKNFSMSVLLFLGSPRLCIHPYIFSLSYFRENNDRKCVGNLINGEQRDLKILFEARLNFLCY